MSAGGPVLLGVGLDVVDLRRFARSAGQRGFLERICTVGEMAQLPELPEERVRLAACFFAYKEAVLKALGSGAWQQGTSFQDVDVLLGGAGSAGRGPGTATVTLRDGAARVQAAGGGGRLELAHQLEQLRVKAYCLWLGEPPA